MKVRYEDRQKRKQLAITDDIIALRCCHVQACGDGNLVGAGLGALAAAALSVALIDRDGLRRSRDSTDGDGRRGLCGTWQAHALAYVLHTRRAGVAGTIGHCSRKLALLAQLPVSEVDGCSDGRSREIRENRMRRVG